MIAILF